MTESEMAMTTETGYLTIPVHADYNPEDSREEATKAAARENAQLVGDPETIPAAEFTWPEGYENLTDSTMKVIRWTMTREKGTAHLGQWRCRKGHTHQGPPERGHHCPDGTDA